MGGGIHGTQGSNAYNLSFDETLRVVLSDANLSSLKILAKSSSFGMNNWKAKPFFFSNDLLLEENSKCASFIGGAFHFNLAFMGIHKFLHQKEP